MIRILTKEEELKIYRNLLEYNECYLDHGSSRVTYPYRWEGKEVVVKFFLDAAGERQTNNECDMFEEYGDKYDCVAAIYARGRNCIICEYVNPMSDYSIDDALDFDTYEDYLSGSHAYEDETLTEEEYHRIREVADFLDDVAGNSSDNRQFGYGYDGLIKAYDFGYSSYQEYKDQVGNMDDYLYEVDVVEEVIWMVENDKPFAEDYLDAYVKSNDGRS